MIKGTVSEFHDFESRLKPAKNRFQLSAGLNLEKLNSIFSGTNNIYARLKFFKFGLWRRNLKWSSSNRVTFAIHNGALCFVWSRMKWDIYNFPIKNWFYPIFGISMKATCGFLNAKQIRKLGGHVPYYWSD